MQMYLHFTHNSFLCRNCNTRAYLSFENTIFYEIQSQCGWFFLSGKLVNQYLYSWFWLIWANTWPSCTCVITDYQYYTMSLSQYHWCCQHHDSMFIPWPHFYTMSPCLYNSSLSVPWVLINSMHPCLYHKSLPIIWINV